MKEITKYRIFNRYRIAVFIIFILGFFISWFFISDLFDLIFSFDFDAPDLEGDGIRVQKSLISSRLTFDVYNESTFTYTSLSVVIMVCLLAVIFLSEKTGYFSYQFFRTKNIKKSLFKNMFIHSFLNAVTLYAAYMIFLVIGLFINNDITTVSNTRFNIGLSTNDAFLQYTITGIIKFFIFPFVYSIFSFSISFVTQNKYMSVIFPVGFYLILTIIIGGIGVFWLTPAVTLDFGWIGGAEPVFGVIPFQFAVLVPLIFPLILSIILLQYYFVRSERIEN